MEETNGVMDEEDGPIESGTSAATVAPTTPTSVLEEEPTTNTSSNSSWSTTNKNDTIAAAVAEDENNKDDAAWISLAEEHSANERHIDAAECLRRVRDASLLQASQKYRDTLEMARLASAVRDDLLSPNPESDGWKKQGETHGKRDTMIYYKVNHPDNTIVTRIETLIESSLLCPLLSVLNETELFSTWMPKWKAPRLGISESNCWKEMGRGHQIVQICIDMPFPFDNREAIQHVFAVDSIERDNAIIVKMITLDEGEHCGIAIPPVKKGVRRVDATAGFMIRPCPLNHSALLASAHHSNQQQQHLVVPGPEATEKEPRLLFSLEQQIDAYVAGVPLSLINFYTRTALGQMWGALLQVAEDVQQGRRPDHQKQIQAKPELYEWMEQRVQVMLSR